jgi:quercetin dioxygenase-like cupin family protein
MTLKELHTTEKGVSAKPFFKGIEGTAMALQIKKKGILKEHITKVPTILTCIQGEVIFENEKNLKKTLSPGSYIEIEPLVKHWITGVKDSQLILLK